MSLAVAKEKLLAARNEIDDALAALESEEARQDLFVPAPAAPVPAKGLTAPTAFFDGVRGKLWPRMSETQVSGCLAILTACAGVYPTSWAAYALATAYHETAYSMQPIREKGSGDRDGDGRDDYLAKYDTGKLAANLGNTPGADGDGIRYAGRGYVQLTGTRNYAKATAQLRMRGVLTPNESLIDTPDLAMRPDVAAAVMVFGMLEGWFTGKSLRDYVPAKPQLPNFVSARRIINGTDRADDIAKYAMSFYSALLAGGWQ